MSAIQHIAVINGKPALYGDAILAVCSGHPDFENIEEIALLGVGNKVTGYTCTVKRNTRLPVSQSFTVEMATEAGLWGRQVLGRLILPMLQMRARAFALRDSFADALGGVRVVEEVQDFYRETRNITPVNAKEELRALIDRQRKS